MEILYLLECYAPNDKLTLKELSHKLVTLLALLKGQRCQTIHKLSVRSMKLEDNKCVFYITSLLKQSKQGKYLAPIELLQFPRNKNICVVEIIKEYLRRTKVFRDGHTQLLLSYLKPHLPISKDTLPGGFETCCIKREWTLSLVHTALAQPAHLLQPVKVYL